MLRGIYSSAAGMIMQMDKVSMHAENIANAQSAGFRRREMSSVPFKELMINIMEKQDGKGIKVPVGTGSGASFETLDSTQGVLKPTGSAFDIAIEGNGWLTFRKGNYIGQGPVGTQGPVGAQGEYTTRNGRMLLNNDGFIINADGHFLVDQKGKNIQVPVLKGLTKEEIKQGKKLPPLPKDDVRAKDMQSRITIDENGKIFDGGKLLALLKLQEDTTQFQNIPELKLDIPVQRVIQRDAKTGNLLPSVPGQDSSKMAPGQKEKVAVRQGFIENSNIQIISEMVGLISASKNYESGHKLIMAEDKILDKAINELGRTG